MNHASSPDDTIRIQINDIYAYLFSLNRKPNHSDREQQQIRVMERLISNAITRKDIPAYSLQQIVELPVAEAERIFGPKLEEWQVLNRIREAVTSKCVLRLA